MGLLALIFQEPMTALNPLTCIGDQVAEGIALHYKYDKKKSFLIMFLGIKDPVPEILIDINSFYKSIK